MVIGDDDGEYDDDDTATNHADDDDDVRATASLTRVHLPMPGVVSF